jgi:hypothetical protein
VGHQPDLPRPIERSQHLHANDAGRAVDLARAGAEGGLDLGVQSMATAKRPRVTKPTDIGARGSDAIAADDDPVTLLLALTTLSMVLGLSAGFDTPR